MPAAIAQDNRTYPQGFLDFLTRVADNGYRIAGHELTTEGLARFNAALHAVSPASPPLTLDQITVAAQRALARYPDGGQPVFVTSRLASLQRLRDMQVDPGWSADAVLGDCLLALDAYRDAPDALLPTSLPVVGQLDDAVLIDVVLQKVRDQLAEYEDFCRFRQIAADCVRVPVLDTGLTRQQWLEALAQARESRVAPAGARRRYVADPRASLFHIT